MGKGSSKRPEQAHEVAPGGLLPLRPDPVPGNSVARSGGGILTPSGALRKSEVAGRKRKSHEGRRGRGAARKGPRPASSHLGGEGGIRTPGTVLPIHTLSKRAPSATRTPLLMSHGRRSKMAEREGFEPPVPLRVHRFSKPAHSAALAPLRSISWFLEGSASRSPASRRPPSREDQMAEREGFEPPVPSLAQRFSKPPRSATPASLRRRAPGRGRLPPGLLYSRFLPASAPSFTPHPGGPIRSPPRARIPGRPRPGVPGRNP